MRIIAKVFRFNPDKFPTPAYKEYGITVDEGMTVLDLLLKIKEDIDGTLSFRCSCRSAICGSCAMEINGFEKLACKTQVKAEYERHGEIIVRPLKNAKVLKDLAVDMVPFWDKIKEVKPWLVPASNVEGEGRKTCPDLDEVMGGVDNCIKCGACVSACTSNEVSPGFIGPAALAKAYRFTADPRDTEKLERLVSLDGENGIWDCARCYYCWEVCPKDVRPVEAIVRLRRDALNNGIDGTMGAKHINCFTQSVKEDGLVNETALPMKMMKTELRAMVSTAPLGFKMLMRGKLMSPFRFPIRGIKEVRAIFKKFENKRRKRA